MMIQLFPEYLILCNDSATRRFIGIPVVERSGLLDRILHSVNRTLKKFGKATYYESPKYHISIASMIMTKDEDGVIAGKDDNNLKLISVNHLCNVNEVLQTFRINANTKYIDDSDNSDGGDDTIDNGDTLVPCLRISSIDCKVGNKLYRLTPFNIGSSKNDRSISNDQASPSTFRLIS